MTGKRRPSAQALIARREKEDADLRFARGELVAKRQAIDADIARIDRLLGAPVIPAANMPASRAITVGVLATCQDCGVRVPAPELGSECPACGASPFEGKEVRESLQ